MTDILPPMEEDDQINIRTGEDLARRLLVLSYLNCVALQPELEQILERLEAKL